MLRKFCSQDLVTVIVQYQINGKRRNIIVASGYLPFDFLYPPPTQKLRDLVAYAESSGLELLISCDAKAQHISWGSSKCNPKGKKLFDFISSAGLMTAKIRFAPTFVGLKRSGVIDLTICTSKMLELITHQRVLDEVSLSDHRYLEFNLTIADEQSAVQRWNPRKTDWINFNDDD